MDSPWLPHAGGFAVEEEGVRRLSSAEDRVFAELGVADGLNGVLGVGDNTIMWSSKSVMNAPRTDPPINTKDVRMA